MQLEQRRTAHSLHDAAADAWQAAPSGLCCAKVLWTMQRQADGGPLTCLPKHRQLLSQGKGWARYDARVGALLDMGAAGVVESLLRLTVRLAPLHEQAAPLNGRVCCCASGCEHKLQHASAWGMDRRDSTIA